MSFNNTPTNFFECIVPFLVISVLLGVYPIFPLNKNGKYYLYTSKKLQFISISIMILYTMLFIIVTVGRTNNVVGKNFYKGNRISNFDIGFEFLFGMIIFYTSYAVSLIQTGKIKNVLNEIKVIDAILRNVGQKFTNQHENLKIILGAVIAAGYILFVTYIQSQNIKKELNRDIKPLMWVIFIYPVFVVHFITTYYMATVKTIYFRFHMINKELKEIKEELFSKKFGIITVLSWQVRNKTNSTLVKRVQIFMQIHHKLCKLAQKTNNNYNIQMLPILIHQFSIPLYSVFYFLWMYQSKPVSSLCWLAWGGLKAYELLILSYYCHIAKIEAELVGRSVHKILIKTDLNSEISEKLLMFSEQVMQYKFKFSLCGLFDIDATFLFNVIGSSTTLIVIMSQFQASSIPVECLQNNNSITTNP